jgi:hypothetical protein
MFPPSFLDIILVKYGHGFLHVEPVIKTIIYSFLQVSVFIHNMNIILNNLFCFHSGITILNRNETLFQILDKPNLSFLSICNFNRPAAMTFFSPF